MARLEVTWFGCKSQSSLTQAPLWFPKPEKRKTDVLNLLAQFGFLTFVHAHKHTLLDVEVNAREGQ